jgi:hypothetical protein
VILPRRLEQPGLGLNARGTYATPVGIVRPQDWGDARFNGGIIGNAQIVDSGLVLVAGYNSFMLVATLSSGSFNVDLLTPDYSDESTPYSILWQDVVGNAAAPGTRLLMGAPTAVRPNDTWGMFKIRLQGTAALGATDCFLTMLCSTR